MNVRCIKCEKSFDLTPMNVCPSCGRPGEITAHNWTLEIEYDMDKLNGHINRNSFQKGSGIWRYAVLLPVTDLQNCISLSEGSTPLLRCDRLAREYGLEHLYLKNETQNPTCSFKDRAAAVLVSKASEWKFSSICAVSDGNHGSAIAAYSAKASKDCYIMLYPGVSQAKMKQMCMYGAHTFLARGTVAERVKLFQEIHQQIGSFLANLDHVGNPLAVEGYKTIAFEICEQLDWAIPDHLIIPVGSGEAIAGIWKGFKEFYALGLIDSLPHVSAVQVEGNDPLVVSANAKNSTVEPLPKAAPTICAGIDTDITALTALRALIESGGYAVSVNDDSIIREYQKLAQLEGIYTEPAGAVVLAGMRKMMNQGQIRSQETIVCMISSHGLKTEQPTLESMGMPEITIRADIKDFNRYVLKPGGVVG